MNGLRLRGLRAGNLRGIDLEFEHGRWTALHGPSGAGKSAILFGVLEPVARRRFRLLRDPAALPGGDEGWLERIADEVAGLQPVVAWAGEVPRTRRAVPIGRALDLWRPLARAFAVHGGLRCGACGAEWHPPGVEDLLAEAAQAEPGAVLHLYSDAGGALAEELLRAGWTRVRLGGELARLEDAPATLPPDAWLLLDRFRWAPERRERLREALAAAVRRGAALCWEAGAARGERPAPASCPRCATHAPHRAEGELAALAEAEDRVLAGRSWSAWRTAPLSSWLAAGVALPADLGRRLRFLERTGLGHLHAARELGTLSLGEARRLELAALACLIRRDQLLLCDEPGLGLHGRERLMLAALLRELAAQGNTVLTADPAREFLEGADAWVLLGPGGGPAGGRVVAQGVRAELPPYGRELLPPHPPAAAGALRFRRLRARTLDIAELELPLGALVAICGVSGSGKSTLLEAELVPRLRRGAGFTGALPAGGVAVLLERALGSAAMSTVATLAGAWAEVRRAFAGGEEGRIRGLAPADLVARPGQGACAACGGHGADDDRLPCAGCGGLGLREDLLELRLRGRSLREWLEAPLATLERRLPAGSTLRRLLALLDRLGLGERRLGERGRHLSLGERGRLALARELALARRDRPKLFLLDEPCLGLPAGEARRVVEVLRALRDEGHSFWVIEHHEILLRGADHLVELGPGAGPDGGRLIYAGPPASLLAADTPSGRWLRDAEPVPAPPPPAPPPLAALAGAVPEALDRRGRRALEDALRRELATRSPLLADALPLAEEPAESLPPVAWPGSPPATASLLAILGLEARLDDAVRRAGIPACAACGGLGPWPDLAQAVLGGAPDALAAGAWRFTAPLVLGEDTRGSGAALLRAAGFRRLLRQGELLALGPRSALEPDDEVLLDGFDPRAENDAPVRLRELEHHARLLAGGVVRARAAGRAVWEFRAGACRSCGIGSAAVPALLERRLAGRSAHDLREAPLGEALAHLARHAPAAAPFARAAELLAGTSLLRHPGSARPAGLSPLEAALARLAGWLLFPLEGIVLLHDQPLAALPVALARRLAAALQGPGRHRWTDAEGYVAPVESAPRPAAGFGPRPHGGLELDLARWAEPPPATAGDTLRAALGLEEAFRRQFLATEEARLRGWGAPELAPGRAARVCPECRGHGGVRPHPALRVPCPRCGGSGWGAETAALEVRGLAWTELGRRSLAELARHFADTPSLAGPLAVATACGLGALPLDTELAALPRGVCQLAPLAAALAAGTELASCRLAFLAAGLTPLEASRMTSTMGGYPSGSCVPEWIENHPWFEPTD